MRGERALADTASVKSTMGACIQVTLDGRDTGVAPEPIPRVLLVGGSEVEHLAHARLLKDSRSAFAISAVNTVNDALHSIRARPYDVIVLDIDAREANVPRAISELTLAAP